MRSLDLPDEPGEPDRVRHADHPAAGPARAREMPDPDERDRAYEAMWASASAEADPAGQAPEANGRANRTGEVSPILEARAHHEEPAPIERPVEGSADPPEPDRDDGSDRSAAAREADTTEAIARVREAEPAISADVQEVARENTYGGWLEGFQCHLKGESRLKAKVAEKLVAEPNMTAGQALAEVADAIRYTYCFQPENYTKGYYDIKERLESRGYEMYFSKNWWTNPEYKGINTRWVTAEGQRFEVQFHTPESFHAKHHVTHTAYEKIRNPNTSRAERRELHAFQREVSAQIEIPDGATDIPDVRKELF